MTDAAALLAALCLARGGALEHVLDDGSRIDCLTDTHAIEVEYSRDWAESVGQAIHYGSQARRPALIVLIVDDAAGCRHLARLYGALYYVRWPVMVEAMGKHGKC